MFSECMIRVQDAVAWIPTNGFLDASRFLAQSQSRLSFAPNEERRSAGDRSRRPNPTVWRSSTASRPKGQKSVNPYQPSASQASGFPFASRLNPQQAPLFFSATDEFREENDEEEHDREIADYYALQKSRRHLGGSDLKESSNADADSSTSLHASGDEPDEQHQVIGRGGGIRSSWRGGAISGRSRAREPRSPDIDEGRSERTS